MNQIIRKFMSAFQFRRRLIQTVNHVGPQIVDEKFFINFLHNDIPLTSKRQIGHSSQRYEKTEIEFWGKRSGQKYTHRLRVSNSLERPLRGVLIFMQPKAGSGNRYCPPR